MEEHRPPKPLHPPPRRLPPPCLCPSPTPPDARDLGVLPSHPLPPPAGSAHFPPPPRGRRGWRGFGGTSRAAETSSEPSPFRCREPGKLAPEPPRTWQAGRELAVPSRKLQSICNAVSLIRSSKLNFNKAFVSSRLIVQASIRPGR